MIRSYIMNCFHAYGQPHSGGTAINSLRRNCHMPMRVHTNLHLSDGGSVGSIIGSKKQFPSPCQKRWMESCT